MPFKSSLQRAVGRQVLISRLNADTSHEHTIWVGGLPLDCANPEEVTDIFSPFGEVINVTVRKKYGDSAKSWSLVSFGDTLAVSKVLSRTITARDNVGNDFHLDIKHAEPEKHLSNNVAAGGNIGALAAIWKTHCSVYIGRIPVNAATGAGVKALFSKFGKIAGVHIQLPGQDTGLRNVAWACLTYSAPRAVGLAVQHPISCLDVNSGMDRQLQVLRWDLAREVGSVATTPSAESPTDVDLLIERLGADGSARLPEQSATTAPSAAPLVPISVDKKWVHDSGRIYYRAIYEPQEDGSKPKPKWVAVEGLMEFEHGASLAFEFEDSLDMAAIKIQASYRGGKHRADEKETAVREAAEEKADNEADAMMNAIWAKAKIASGAATAPKSTLKRQDDIASSVEASAADKLQKRMEAKMCKLAADDWKTKMNRQRDKETRKARQMFLVTRNKHTENKEAPPTIPKTPSFASPFAPSPRHIRVHGTIMNGTGWDLRAGKGPQIHRWMPPGLTTEEVAAVLLNHEKSEYDTLHAHLVAEQHRSNQELVEQEHVLAALQERHRSEIAAAVEEDRQARMAKSKKAEAAAAALQDEVKADMHTDSVYTAMEASVSSLLKVRLKQQLAARGLRDDGGSATLRVRFISCVESERQLRREPTEWNAAEADVEAETAIRKKLHARIKAVTPALLSLGKAGLSKKLALHGVTPAERSSLKKNGLLEKVAAVVESEAAEQLKHDKLIQRAQSEIVAAKLRDDDATNAAEANKRTKMASLPTRSKSEAKKAAVARGLDPKTKPPELDMASWVNGIERDEINSQHKHEAAARKVAFEKLDFEMNGQQNGAKQAVAALSERQRSETAAVEEEDRAAQRPKADAATAAALALQAEVDSDGSNSAHAEMKAAVPSLLKSNLTQQVARRGLSVEGVSATLRTRLLASIEFERQVRKFETEAEHSLRAAAQNASVEARAARVELLKRIGTAAPGLATALCKAGARKKLTFSECDSSELLKTALLEKVAVIVEAEAVEEAEQSDIVAKALDELAAAKAANIAADDAYTARLEQINSMSKDEVKDQLLAAGLLQTAARVGLGLAALPPVPSYKTIPPPTTPLKYPSAAMAARVATGRGSLVFPTIGSAMKWQSA